MPTSPTGPHFDSRDAIRRFRAADNKARNEQQKSILLKYVAQLRSELASGLMKALQKTTEHVASRKSRRGSA